MNPFCLGTFILVIGLVIVNSWYTHLEWNGGICKESGKPWRHFDLDSDGNHGYSDGCGNYLWSTFDYKELPNENS